MPNQTPDSIVKNYLQAVSDTSMASLDFDVTPGADDLSLRVTKWRGYQEDFARIMAQVKSDLSSSGFVVTVPKQSRKDAGNERIVIDLAASNREESLAALFEKTEVMHTHAHFQKQAAAKAQIDDFMTLAERYAQRPVLDGAQASFAQRLRALAEQIDPMTKNMGPKTTDGFRNYLDQEQADGTQWRDHYK